MFNVKLTAVFSIALLFSCLTNAIAQLRDTAIYYFKQVDGIPHPVSQLEYADFFRIIPPFGLRDNSVEIKEYYKDGHLMFVGTAQASGINVNEGRVSLNGTCLEYFPNGKRKRITTYKDGHKQDLEYYYYPDGSPFKIVKYEIEFKGLVSIPMLETFFDKQGKELCTRGNGKAYEYNSNFEIVRVGNIKNGKKDGIWKGRITGQDSAKYILNFVNDEYISGIGYDTLNVAHPFKIINVNAKPPGNRFLFIEKFRRLVKKLYGPKGIDNILDSTAVTFTVSEDGSLSDLKSADPVSAELVLAMKNALTSCAKWQPAYMYGIALKTTVGLELGITVEPGSNGWVSKTNLGFELHYYNGHQIISDE